MNVRVRVCVRACVGNTCTSRTRVSRAHTARTRTVQTHVYVTRKFNVCGEFKVIITSVEGRAGTFRLEVSNWHNIYHRYSFVSIAEVGFV